MAIDKNQILEVKLNKNNRDFYRDRGYKFSDYEKVISILLKDLPLSSHILVDYTCDYCSNVFKIKFSVYNRKKSASQYVRKDACVNCKSKKQTEIYKKQLTNVDVLKHYKKIINGEKEQTPYGLVKYMSKGDLKNILNYLIQKSLEDGIVKNEEEIPKKFNSNLFKRYNVSSLITHNSIYDMLNLIYPDRWMRWETSTVGNNFWDDERNWEKAYNWLINKLIKEKRIESIDDILITTDKKIFKDSGLEGLLNLKFDASPVKFWMNFNPNRWFEWEFSLTPRNYWTKKENRIFALKSLIEDRLFISKKDIPNIITYSFLVNNYHKFSLICDQYYESNIFAWMDECYPNEFEKEQFFNNVASDGTMLDSNLEKVIHEYLIKTFDNVHYCFNKQKSKKWHNNEENEYYIADWIINDKIIVEFFGLYEEYHRNNNTIFSEYINKTERKIKHYNSLKDYDFIPIFKEDLKENLIGVKRKFKRYISKIS